MKIVANTTPPEEAAELFLARYRTLGKAKERCRTRMVTASALSTSEYYRKVLDLLQQRTDG